MSKKNFVLVNIIYSIIAALFSVFWYKSIFNISPSDGGVTQLFVTVFVYLILSSVLAFMSSRNIPKYFWLWPLFYFISFFIINAVDEVGKNFLTLFKNDNFLSLITLSLIIILPSLITSIAGKYLYKK
ncbi:MAG: hypothetical protein OEV93_02500 [Candidatus Moranbacteria bacterium]|nr:hypothetical protein [Candidatus Moranbacteria bacterium]